MWIGTVRIVVVNISHTPPESRVEQRKRRKMCVTLKQKARQPVSMCAHRVFTRILQLTGFSFDIFMCPDRRASSSWCLMCRSFSRTCLGRLRNHQHCAAFFFLWLFFLVQLASPYRDRRQSSGFCAFSSHTRPPVGDDISASFMIQLVREMRLRALGAVAPSQHALRRPTLPNYSARCCVPASYVSSHRCAGVPHDVEMNEFPI